MIPAKSSGFKVCCSAVPTIDYNTGGTAGGVVKSQDYSIFFCSQGMHPVCVQWYNGIALTAPFFILQPIAQRITKKGAKHKNEIFVDILERLSVVFDSSGYVLSSEIDGCIQMKSYLSGQPELRLALNEDLIIGKVAGSLLLLPLLSHCSLPADSPVLLLWGWVGAAFS